MTFQASTHAIYYPLTRATVDPNSQEYPNLTELIPMAVTQGLSHYKYIL